MRELVKKIKREFHIQVAVPRSVRERYEKVTATPGYDWTTMVTAALEDFLEDAEKLLAKENGNHARS